MKSFRQLVALGLLLKTLAGAANAQITNILNFDSIDASTGAVDATVYLAANGVTLGGVTAGTKVVVESDLQFYGTPGIVYASSPHNFLNQIGNAYGNSFTLIFPKPLSGLSFTRITETGGPGSGNSFGQWSVEVFQGTNQIGQAGESAYALFGATQINPAQTYTFTGPGITSIEFDGNALGSYGTGSILADDLTLVFPAPALGIAATGNQTVLFWPADSTNYVLQSTTNLASPTWATATDAVPVIAVTVTNSMPARFFRLSLP